MSERNIDLAFIIIVVLGFALLITPVLGFFLLPNWPLRFNDLIDIIGAISPPLVTLLLAYLYLQLRNITSDQRNIEETQTEIQKQQQRILELEYLPQLIVDSWQVDNDRMDFKITNVGRGAAYNIGYVLECIPFELADPPIQTELNPEFDFEEMIPFVRDDSGVSTHKNTLEASCTGEFSETACLSFQSESEKYLSFSDGTQNIDYTSVDCYIDIRLWITYHDEVHDQMQAQPVMDVILKRNQVEGKTFAEAVSADPVGDTRYGNGNRMILPENVDESRLERFRRHGRTTTYLDLDE